MKLTLEQQRVLDDWFRRKIEHHNCSLCQSSHLRIGELFPPSDRDVANHASPTMVQVICQNCGHVLLFDTGRIKDWHSVDTYSDLM